MSYLSQFLHDYISIAFEAEEIAVEEEHFLWRNFERATGATAGVFTL